MDKVNDSYVSNSTKLRIAQFKDGIESVVDIYKQAREHCLRYKTDTFGKMVRLARDLYSYARDVEVRCHLPINQSSSTIVNSDILRSTLQVNRLP